MLAASLLAPSVAGLLLTAGTIRGPSATPSCVARLNMYGGDAAGDPRPVRGMTAGWATEPDNYRRFNNNYVRDFEPPTRAAQLTGRGRYGGVQTSQQSLPPAASAAPVPAVRDGRSSGDAAGDPLPINDMTTGWATEHDNMRRFDSNYVRDFEPPTRAGRFVGKGRYGMPVEQPPSQPVIDGQPRQVVRKHSHLVRRQATDNEITTSWATEHDRRRRFGQDNYALDLEPPPARD